MQLKGSLRPNLFPITPSHPLSAVIMAMRFPHRTRVIGLVPLDGHKGVGWEPELTPHNNCLATAVPPATQSDFGVKVRRKMERN